MSARYLLGIDVGTTAIKAAVFDTDGIEVGSFTAEYTLLTPRAGQVELDVETYVTTFALAVARCRKQLSPPPRSRCLGSRPKVRRSAAWTMTISLLGEQSSGWTPGRRPRPRSSKNTSGVQHCKPPLARCQWTRSIPRQSCSGCEPMSLSASRTLPSSLC